MSHDGGWAAAEEWHREQEFDAVIDRIVDHTGGVHFGQFIEDYRCDRTVNSATDHFISVPSPYELLAMSQKQLEQIKENVLRGVYDR